MVVLLADDFLHCLYCPQNFRKFCEYILTNWQYHKLIPVDVVVAVIPLKALVPKPSLLHCCRCIDHPLRHSAAQTCEALTFPTAVRPVLAGLYYMRLRPSTRAPGALMASEEPRRHSRALACHSSLLLVGPSSIRVGQKIVCIHTTSDVCDVYHLILTRWSDTNTESCSVLVTGKSLYVFAIVLLQRSHCADKSSHVVNILLKV